MGGAAESRGGAVNAGAGDGDGGGEGVGDVEAHAQDAVIGEPGTGIA